ncbi:MAG: class I SAM-dependent methyltransferase [Pseudomonadota bacterium]
MEPKARSEDAASVSNLGLTAARALPPALKALAGQFGALLSVLFVLAPVARWSGMELSLQELFFLQGLLAAAAGALLGLAWWWLPINLLFAPAVIAQLSLGISPFWYLTAFLLLLLVYGGASPGGVPLYLSSRQAHRAVAAYLPERPGFHFVDLGAGTGGVIAHLGRQHPDGNFLGIEKAPLPFALGWLRARAAGRNCRIVWGNYWALDLAQADVVYAYLSPLPMSELWRKVRAEMRSGTLFISNTFAVPGIAPSETLHLDDLHRSKLYVYRL